MAKNSKPILSVLIDEDKRTKFADLARRHSLSMGYLVNKAVDRMLELNSIDIYGEPARTRYMDSTPTLSIDTIDVESLVKTSIDKLDIENLIKTSIASLNTSSIDTDEIENLVNTSIDSRITPLTESVTELEIYTQSQFKAVREELKKALSDRVTPDTIAPVQVEMNLPIAKLSPEGDPDWVNSDNRRFYSRLIEDSDLLSKVTEAIAQNPKDNAALSKSLVELGFHRKDGTGYDSASISRIKNVTNRLNTSQAV